MIGEDIYQLVQDFFQPKYHINDGWDIKGQMGQVPYDISGRTIQERYPGETPVDPSPKLQGLWKWRCLILFEAYLIYKYDMSWWISSPISPTFPWQDLWISWNLQENSVAELQKIQVLQIPQGGFGQGRICKGCDHPVPWMPWMPWIPGIHWRFTGLNFRNNMYR